MIGIVVLIYKSHEQVLAYVRNELPKIGVPHRTLIVDTGSERAHAERLAAELGVAVVTATDTVADGSLFVLHVEENLGYARGNNLGAEFLTRNFPDTDKLLFSNDDIEFISSDVVDVLSRRMDEIPEIGCLGPKVIDLNGDLQGPGYEKPQIGYYIRRNIGEPLFGAKRFWLWKDRERKSEFVNIVGGCFHMVRTTDFQAVGGFDPETFLYWEEELLSERLRKIVRQAYYDASVSIRHFVGNTTSKKAPNLLLLNCELFGQRLFFGKYEKSSALMMGLLRLSQWIRVGLVKLAILKRKLRGADR